MHFRIQPLIDPNGDLMWQLKKSPATLWVALKANVATNFSVSKEEWPWPVAPGSMLSYQVDVETLSIQDSDEPNDTGDPATPLTKDVPKQSRMAGVIDADGRTVGLKVWFSIEQSDCVIDCFDVTKPLTTHCYTHSLSAQIKAMVIVEGGGPENLAKACSDTLGADIEEVPESGNKSRYFKVECYKGDCPVFGEGEIPANYITTSTYKIKWSEECKYGKTDENTYDRLMTCK